MTAKHLISQNTRKSCPFVKNMNVLEKEKKRLCPFSFVKAKSKEREKPFSCDSAADTPASRDKRSSVLQPRRMATTNRRTYYISANRI